MSFCTKCGQSLTGQTNFCGHCGTQIPATEASSSATAAAGSTSQPPIESAVERDARLKREHNKLVNTLGLLSGLLTLVLVGILGAVGNAMGPTVGGACLGLLAFVALAAFIASFAPRLRPRFEKLMAREKPIDPLTGKPLRMMWWIRWFSAVSALGLFLSVGAVVSPPPPPQSSTQTAAPAPPKHTQLKGGYVACMSNKLLDEWTQAVINKDSRGEELALKNGCIVTQAGTRVYLSNASSGFGVTAVYLYTKDGEQVTIWTPSENIIMGSDAN